MSSSNAYKGGVRPQQRALSRALRDHLNQLDQLNDALEQDYEH